MFAPCAILLMGLASLSFGTLFHEHGGFVRCKDDAHMPYDNSPISFQLINWPTIKDEVLTLALYSKAITITTINRSYYCSYETEDEATSSFTEMVKLTWEHTGDAVTDPFKFDHVAMSWLALNKMEQVTCNQLNPYSTPTQTTLQMSFDLKVTEQQASMYFGPMETCIAFLQKAVDEVAIRKEKELEKEKEPLSFLLFVAIFSFTLTYFFLSSVSFLLTSLSRHIL